MSCHINAVQGTTWEGGQRVPSIARWSGTVEPGSIAWQMTSSMDFFATALELAGVPLPTDRTIYAISYASLLQTHGHVTSSHGNRTTFYYWGKNPNPVRDATFFLSWTPSVVVGMRK